MFHLKLQVLAHNSQTSSVYYLSVLFNASVKRDVISSLPVYGGPHFLFHSSFAHLFPTYRKIICREPHHLNLLDNNFLRKCRSRKLNEVCGTACALKHNTRADRTLCSGFRDHLWGWKPGPANPSATQYVVGN